MHSSSSAQQQRVGVQAAATRTATRRETATAPRHSPVPSGGQVRLADGMESIADRMTLHSRDQPAVKNSSNGPQLCMQTRTRHRGTRPDHCHRTPRAVRIRCPGMQATAMRCDGETLKMTSEHCGPLPQNPENVDPDPYPGLGLSRGCNSDAMRWQWRGRVGHPCSLRCAAGRDSWTCAGERQSLRGWLHYGRPAAARRDRLGRTVLVGEMLLG